MANSDDPMLLAAEVRNANLRSIITNALKAMDEGRMGDLRRIFTKGTDKALMTETAVVAKDGA